MPETSDDIYARAKAVQDADGRLPLPAYVEWDIFPFEGDLRVRPLDPPVLPEPPRNGEGEEPCYACASPGSRAVWGNDSWTVSPVQEPNGLPATVLLQTREHLDLGDLSDELAAELGLLVVRLNRAITALPGVARMHVNRWGDGGSHLHIFCYARPAGFQQLRGTCLALWDDILPPTPQDVWDANLAAIAAALAASHGGTSLVA